MDGFVIAPKKNRPGSNDATGAFHIGANRITEIHDVPRKPIFFENEGSALSIYKGFSKHIDDAKGGWDFFAYFGHGESWGLVSACISRREGALELARRIIPKANPGLTVMLYACNCGDKGGFAEWLADGLSPVGATVYAHVSPPGHTFTNANVVSYPGGEWVVPRGHRLWGDWYNDMHNEWGDLWARFPFMTQDQLEAELEAPERLLGRWKVGAMGDSYDVVFFGDKAVVRTDSSRFGVVAEGTWTATRFKLTVTWADGTTEAWPLPLSMRGQNVHSVSGSQTTHKKASRTEDIDHNPQTLFMSPARRGKLIDI